MNENIIFGQDASRVSDEIIKEFELSYSDVRYDYKLKVNVFNFVGFIFKDKNVLVVFPKHFYKNEEIALMNSLKIKSIDDATLLFNVISKYVNETKTKSNAEKYIGNANQNISDFPFKEFYNIYQYFLKFGIFKEKNTEIKPNINGKVSWKKTIEKSDKVISGNNLIFLPIYMKRSKNESIFISECMHFILTYTFNKFKIIGFYRTLPPMNYSFDFIEHKLFTLSKLQDYLGKVFKDVNKKLILNMIGFLEQLDDKCVNGNIHVKISYFNNIWEAMVQKYLNEYFGGVDEFNEKIIFNETKNNASVEFVKFPFEVDNSDNNYVIDPDHYAIENNTQYILDSKYYTNLDKLNYKQLAYGEILKEIDEEYKTFNALLLPGTNESKVHFELKEKYIKSSKDIKIIEQYLEMKKIMLAYLN